MSVSRRLYDAEAQNAIPENACPSFFLFSQLPITPLLPDITSRWVVSKPHSVRNQTLVILVHPGLRFSLEKIPNPCVSQDYTATTLGNDQTSL